MLDKFLNTSPNILGLTQSVITRSMLTTKTLRSRCEICSKLTIKTSKRRHWRRSGVFVVTFDHISLLVPVFLFLTLIR